MTSPPSCFAKILEFFASLSARRIGALPGTETKENCAPSFKFESFCIAALESFISWKPGPSKCNEFLANPSFVTST